MAHKATQWLALAMLLSIALGALAAKQEDAKPADSPVEASVAAKHKDNNYHHKDNYNLNNYKGSENYPKGDDYYPKGGEYYPKGSEYYPKGGDYYPRDADYYPTAYSPEQYPHDYYGHDEYHHDEYPSNYNSYGENYPSKGYYPSSGKSLWIPTPAQATAGGTMNCPALTPGGFGTCSIVCPSASNGVYPFGCFYQSTGPYATVTCPAGYRASDCDCDCDGDGLLALCIKTNIGGYRKTCMSGCNAFTLSTGSGNLAVGKAQVRATCEPIPHGRDY